MPNNSWKRLEKTLLTKWKLPHWSTQGRTLAQIESTIKRGHTLYKNKSYL